MVDAQPELIRSRVPLFCFARQPATQVLSASTFINQNVFHAPLVLVVPPEVTNAQAKGVAETTSTEIKGVLEAMVKAIEHSGDPKSGQLGYSRDALMTIFTRAARAMRTQGEALKKNRQDRAEASKQKTALAKDGRHSGGCQQERGGGPHLRAHWHQVQHGLPKHPQQAPEINLQRRRCVDDIPAWSSRVTLRHDNV